MRHYRRFCIDTFDSVYSRDGAAEAYLFMKSVFPSHSEYSEEDIHNIIQGMLQDGCSRVKLMYTVKIEDDSVTPRELTLLGFGPRKQTAARVLDLVFDDD